MAESTEGTLNVAEIYRQIMAEKSVNLKGSRDYKFTNWSKTFSCTPELYFEPTTTDEIKKILEEAVSLKKKVKVVGCGNSPSDITCTSEYMISLRKYNKILSVNKEKQQVTTQAGITLHEFDNQLRKYGLGVPLISTLSDVTLGGAIATGTHNTGVEYGVLATSVVELTLLCANGEVLRCSCEENEDIFNAARCHLGAVGIILDLTWQCESAFKLASKKKAGKLDEVLHNLENDVKQSEHYRFLWWPHTNDVVIWTMDRTDKPIQTRESWFWNYLIGFHLLQLVYWISSFFPFLVKFINKYHFLWLNSHPAEVVNESEKVFSYDCLFQQYVTDWAIPREKTPYVLNRMKKWLDESGFFAHMPVEVRFTKGDDIYMSPAYGRDTCFINIIMYRPYGKFIPHEDYWNFYEDLVLSVGGRPHWAKAHKMDPDTFSTLYPRFDDFRNICRKLDPHHIFVNAYLERSIFRQD